MSHSNQSPWRQMLRAFIASPTGLISAAVMLGLTVLIIMGPDGFGSEAVVSNMARSSEGPSAEFLLGTDTLGRDILTRSLAATRISIVYASLAVLIAMAAGGLVGGLLAA